MTVLNKAYSCWSKLAGLRRRRDRCKRFTYGDQWSDRVRSRGRWESEAEYIERSGKHPYTNNLIRQLVKTVVGRYRREAAEVGAYKGDIADTAARNSLAELDARTLEEFLISGCAIQRVVDERRWGGEGVWVDSVDPRRFFVNAFRDPRGWDIDLIGMLHSMTLPELVNRFAGGDRGRAAELARIYGSIDDEPALGGSQVPGSFFVSEEDGKCRVIEVWTFDSRLLDDSADSAFCWHCRWYAPDGSLLSEYDSPYAHGGHPFAVKFYPLTDGEVHSFVEDVLDQQKFINRLIVTLDHMMACSAKGVLLFPINQLPNGISLEQITDAWAQPDGVIPITDLADHLPQQVNASNSNSDGYRLLQMQMQLFEQISGVGGALMGRSTNARGAEMLDAEVRNGTLALADLFESFAAFTAARNALALRA